MTLRVRYLFHDSWFPNFEQEYSGEELFQKPNLTDSEIESITHLEVGETFVLPKPNEFLSVKRIA